MLKIKILSVGKVKEAWLDQALKEYIKRLQPLVAFDFVWAKDDAQLIQLAQKESAFICLNVTGNMMTSEQFASFLDQEMQRGGSRITFVIGGAEGLPSPLREHLPSISLSPMTFTHQVTRLVLLEQIYRAFEIFKGSKYHK